MTISLTEWMSSLLSSAPAFGQASWSFICVADCKIWLQFLLSDAYSLAMGLYHATYQEVEPISPPLDSVLAL